MDSIIDENNLGRMSAAQKICLVEFMEEHKLFSRNKFLGADGRKRHDCLWEVLATRLNSCDGPKKSSTKWKRSWTDLKNKVKRKAALVKSSFNKTGGGPPVPPLNDFEHRLMELIRECAVSGVKPKKHLLTFDTTEPLPKSDNDSTSTQSISSHSAFIINEESMNQSTSFQESFVEDGVSMNPSTSSHNTFHEDEVLINQSTSSHNTFIGDEVLMNASTSDLRSDDASIMAREDSCNPSTSSVNNDSETSFNLRTGTPRRSTPGKTLNEEKVVAHFIKSAENLNIKLDEINDIMMETDNSKENNSLIKETNTLLKENNSLLREIVDLLKNK